MTFDVSGIFERSLFVSDLPPLLIIDDATSIPIFIPILVSWSKLRICFARSDHCSLPNVFPPILPAAFAASSKLYTGAKKEYFFEQLNQCSKERFEDMSTERRIFSIYGIREAETMLQAEFEDHHEPNSITRMTAQESAHGNGLDGRFRKGLVSDEPNTLNKQFTDLDTKYLMSQENLEVQAAKRRRLGHKNPNALSMYEQGTNTGYSLTYQKSKHCNETAVERPSFPENVEHIVNVLELSTEEVPIVKDAILDGVEIALAEQRGVPKDSISDQDAYQGILFVNEHYTIEGKE